ncbi:unnamed protein product [Trichobilharzia szidati]|nr:unnamed protein product [Trichobilharzia szidati]
MHVHPSLYFIFVGESVINDGVTLAVFDYVYKITCQPNIYMSETTLEIISIGLFIVSAKIVIASLTGVIFGVFACIITRFTGRSSAIEPLVVISGSYLTYLLNYSVHWPGVFSILLFWLIQSAYTFQNITPKSKMTIKRFARMTASISESLIFLTMGYTLVVHDFEWHTNFKLISLFISILWRFIIVFILSVFVNKLHNLQNNLSRTTVFVIGFCGLRGAISHGLTEIVTQECLNNVGIDVNLLRSTSAFLTVFTIIIIGTLMKPLLHLLQMKQENKPTSLFQTLNQQVIWKMCACVEDILGTKEWGRWSSCLPKLERFARHLLLRDPIGRDDILEAFKKVTLALHNAGIATTKNKADHYLSKVYPSLKPLYLQNQQTMRGGGIPSDFYASTMSLDKRKLYHHYQPILTKSMLNIHRLLTGKKISPADLKSAPQKRERRSTFKSWDLTNDYQQQPPPTVLKHPNDRIITLKKPSSHTFSNETLSSENINVLSTERSFSEEYFSSSSKEYQNKGSWRERLKKFVTFTGLESNKADTETEDVNTMLLLSRQYHTADSVTYLDKLKHAMQLKQNAIRLQNYKGSLIRLHSGRSLERMTISPPMQEGAMNTPNTPPPPPTTTTFTKRVTHKPKLPTNFILKTEDETKVEENKSETN